MILLVVCPSEIYLSSAMIYYALQLFIIQVLKNYCQCSLMVTCGYRTVLILQWKTLWIRVQGSPFKEYVLPWFSW